MSDLPDLTLFSNYNNCASESAGASILFATDDFFAAAENLLNDSEPAENDRYTEFGKEMDGWETRRRRENGHDYCIIKLAGKTLIKGFLVDLGYFTGNYPPKISIQAMKLPKGADSVLAPRNPNLIGVKASQKATEKCDLIRSFEWPTIVELKDLTPKDAHLGVNRKHYFSVMNNVETFTHIRLNLHPDGGVARLRVFGEIVASLELMVEQDMLAMQNGGRCISFSNAHYGHPKNMIKPGQAVSMADGWETARRLDRPPVISVDHSGISNIPGKEWAIFKLGARCIVRSIEVDTTHFKGNSPSFISFEAVLKPDDLNYEEVRTFSPFMPMTKLEPNTTHKLDPKNVYKGALDMVKITIYPDGGVARVRMLGVMVDS